MMLSVSRSVEPLKTEIDPYAQRAFEKVGGGRNGPLDSLYPALLVLRLLRSGCAPHDKIDHGRPRCITTLGRRSVKSAVLVPARG